MTGEFFKTVKNDIKSFTYRGGNNFLSAIAEIREEGLMGDKDGSITADAAG